MRRNRLFNFSLVVLVTGSFSCRTTETPEAKSSETLSASSSRSKIDKSGGIPFDSYFELTDFRGKTYLSFMKDQVKPAMDKIATQGYVVGGASAVALAYKNTDSKVQNKVKSWGGLKTVQDIADQLAGQLVTLDSLPSKLRSVANGIDVYDLSTFIGLASGGGVKIQYSNKNFSYNVHYDETEEKSGRSFGVGPTRLANDASDKQYLDDLQSYVRTSKKDLVDFYQTLFMVLLDSDSSSYDSIEVEGQNVLSDFLAVYTAEQARNLMDNRVSPHWDAALLEVTLMAAFHAGQDEIKLFYYNPVSQKVEFTDTTLRQTPCAIPKKSSKAQLRDYWQFSRNIASTTNCNRSGINITKDEFRKLGARITAYLAANERKIYDRVRVSIGANLGTDNLFESLSYFLISSKAPSGHSAAKIKEITESWVAMLTYMTDESKAITKDIETNSR